MACSQRTSTGGGQPPDPHELDLGSYDVPKLGVDADGDTHYYDAETHRVIVVSAGQAAAKPLGDWTTSEWIDAVDEEIGWDRTVDDLLAEDVRRAAGVED